ncbi:MAG: dihydrofolate reductase family protein [Tannerellaceae bacterium]|jgi:dihydrofolate reductase|nr:dihydrofolate reductase family protein [Tannerellaceae bacterium]
MRKIKLLSTVSIDGFASRVNGDMAWASTEGRNPLEVYDFTSFFGDVNCVVMNRTQYLMLNFQNYPWAFLPGRSYIVLTRKGAPIYYGSVTQREIISVLTTDEEREKGDVYYMRELQKQSNRGDIWVMGDHRLTASLLQNGMVDEICILRMPITMGSGLSFLAGFGAEQRWELGNVVNYPDGALMTCYHRLKTA